MLQFFPALVLLFWQAQFAQADVRGLPLASQLLFCSRSKDLITAPDCLISVLIQKRDPKQTEPIFVPKQFSTQDEPIGLEDLARSSDLATLHAFLIVRPADRMRDGPALV